MSACSAQSGDDGAMAKPDTYALLDCGDGRRLEAFGDLVVDRPAPGADLRRRDPGAWAGAIAYRAGRGWAAADGSQPPDNTAEVDLGGVTVTVQLGTGGQVSLFPEHGANVPWIRAAIARRLGAEEDAPPEVLNLFAHTGLLTLVAADAGARVVHVDASRPAVDQARRNATASGLEDRPIRWLIDDALAFVRREARRGRRYAGLILDPPTYGHGGAHGRGITWQFDTDIEELLAACLEIAEPAAFWVLTTHSVGWDQNRLAATLASALGVSSSTVGRLPLDLAATSGATLRLGAAARLDPMKPDRR